MSVYTSYDGVEMQYSGAAVVQSPACFHPRMSTPEARTTPRQDKLLQRNSDLKKLIDNAISAARAAGDSVDIDHVATNIDRFLRLLPAELPVADVSVTAAGSICFDWDDDPNCQLSIALQKAGRIAFAAYFSGDRMHGAFSFSNVDIPNEILAAAKRWTKSVQDTEASPN